jgi:hypothetical protein
MEIINELESSYRFIALNNFPMPWGAVTIELENMEEDN